MTAHMDMAFGWLGGVRWHMAPSGGSRVNTRFMFQAYVQAMVTRLHSPRGRASKRRWSCSIRLFKGETGYRNLEFLQACECNMPKGKRSWPFARTARPIRRRSSTGAK